MTNRTSAVAFKATLGRDSGGRAGEFMAANLEASAGFVSFDETDIAAALDITELDVL